MLLPTTIRLEAETKRRDALELAGPFATRNLPDVRWLLCGRGRPVSAGTSPYTVVVDGEGASVLYRDNEAARVAIEERWEELGYVPVPYPWHEPPPVDASAVHGEFAELRLSLSTPEVDRYRAAGADAARAAGAVIRTLTPELRELDVAGKLAATLHADGFTTPVVLVGGERRASLYRHPLPTAELLGRFALVSVTAEREGLHVSLSRVVSFGPPPKRLKDAVGAATAVGEAVRVASRPEVSLGELFEVLRRAYERVGAADEWRRHHQGGITGYVGREVLARPGERTRLPETCAVAWNPTVSGGGKSEDTLLVSSAGAEVLTATPELGEGVVVL